MKIAFIQKYLDLRLCVNTPNKTSKAKKTLNDI